MKVDLNIGLVVAGGDNSPTAVTERAVEAVRLMAESTLFGRVRSRIEYVAYEDPTGKPVTGATLITTAVCRDRLPSIRHLIHYLAGRLGQDCIAARFEDDGRAIAEDLIGPGAHAWGAFNPDFFVDYEAVADATERRAA